VISNKDDFTYAEGNAKCTYPCTNMQSFVAQALLRPSFMSGNVYTSSMLDTIICQCYYNTHLRDVLSQLIFSHNPDTQNAYTRLCDGPEAIINNMDDADDRNGTSGHVYQIDIPPSHHGKDKAIYVLNVRLILSLCNRMRLSISGSDSHSPAFGYSSRLIPHCTPSGGTNLICICKS
jgi:hypothetical protein